MDPFKRWRTYSQHCRGLPEPRVGKIPPMNRCSFKALSRSLSVAENLHLYSITLTAWCIAPEKVRTELGEAWEKLNITVLLYWSVGLVGIKVIKNGFYSLFLFLSFKLSWHSTFYCTNLYTRVIKTCLLLWNNIWFPPWPRQEWPLYDRTGQRLMPTHSINESPWQSLTKKTYYHYSLQWITVDKRRISTT